MSKPREFWINPMFSPHKIVNEKEEYCFRVIEKSAYDELEKEWVWLNGEVEKYIMIADKLADEMECMSIMHEENLNELIKTKKALRDTANGKPSEWAYVQLKADADKLAEVLEFYRDASIDEEQGDGGSLARQALKEYRGKDEEN